MIIDQPNDRGRSPSPHKKHQFSNYDCYFSSMTAYNNDSNKLQLYNRSIKDSMKELKNYEKRLKKINQVENEFRWEMLEYLYTIAYPAV